MAEYKSVVVSAGSGGFGGPLTLTPDEKRHKIVNITGGVISDVALRLGEMTGAEVVDGFKTSVPEEEILAVVIDCGGTLRCGIYPQKRIFTVNVKQTGPSGPLAQYIKEDIYVSAVKPNNSACCTGRIRCSCGGTRSEVRYDEEDHRAVRRPYGKDRTDDGRYCRDVLSGRT